LNLARITRDPSAARKWESAAFGAGGGLGSGAWVLAGVLAGVRGVLAAGVLAAGVERAADVLDVQAAMVSTAAIPAAQRTRHMWFSVPERTECLLVSGGGGT
jgi:hypothetical protein